MKKILIFILLVNFIFSASWTTKAPMPTARAAFSSAMVDGKMFSIGGIKQIAQNGIACSINEEYDYLTNIWTTKSSMPTSRLMFGSIVVNKEIYCIGGIDNPDGSIATTVGFVEKYVVTTDTWIAGLANMPTPRYGFSSVALNGKIYAIGGMAYGSPFGGVVKTVEVYDPALDTWETKSSMLNNRVHMSAFVYEGKIYVFGGFSSDVPGNFNQESSYVTGSMEVYDPETDQWTLKSSSLVPKAYYESTIKDGVVYIMGGTSSWNNIMTDSVEEYTLSTDTWETGQSLKSLRGAGSAEVINNKVYVFGGMDGAGNITSSMESLDIIPSFAIQLTVNLVNEEGQPLSGAGYSFYLEGPSPMNIGKYGQYTDSSGVITFNFTSTLNYGLLCLNGAVTSSSGNVVLQQYWAITNNRLIEQSITMHTRIDRVITGQLGYNVSPNSFLMCALVSEYDAFISFYGTTSRTFSWNETRPDFGMEMYSAMPSTNGDYVMGLPYGEWIMILSSPKYDELQIISSSVKVFPGVSVYLHGTIYTVTLNVGEGFNFATGEKVTDNTYDVIYSSGQLNGWRSQGTFADPGYDISKMLYVSVNEVYFDVTSARFQESSFGGNPLPDNKIVNTRLNSYVSMRVLTMNGSQVIYQWTPLTNSGNIWAATTNNQVTFSTITVNIKVVNASGNALENSSLSVYSYVIAKGKLIQAVGYSFPGFTGNNGYLTATKSVASLYETKMMIQLIPTLSYMGTILFIPVTSNQSSSCVVTADSAPYLITGNCYPFTNNVVVNAYTESGLSKMLSFFLSGNISDVDYFSTNINFSMVDANGDYSFRLGPGTWAFLDSRGSIDGLNFITRNLVVGPVASIDTNIPAVEVGTIYTVTLNVGEGFDFSQGEIVTDNTYDVVYSSGYLNGWRGEGTFAYPYSDIANILYITINEVYFDATTARFSNSSFRGYTVPDNLIAITRLNSYVSMRVLTMNGSQVVYQWTPLTNSGNMWATTTNNQVTFSPVTVNIKVVNASGNALENMPLFFSSYVAANGQLILQQQNFTSGYDFYSFTGSDGYFTVTCSVASLYETKLAIQLSPTLSYMGTILYIPVTSNQSISCIVTADSAPYLITGNCYPLKNLTIGGYPESGLSTLFSIFLSGNISNVDYFSTNYNFSNVVKEDGDYSIRLGPGTWALFVNELNFITRNLVVGPVASIDRNTPAVEVGTIYTVTLNVGEGFSFAEWRIVTDNTYDVIYSSGQLNGWRSNGWSGNGTFAYQDYGISKILYVSINEVYFDVSSAMFPMSSFSGYAPDNLIAITRLNSYVSMRVLTMNGSQVVYQWTPLTNSGNIWAATTNNQVTFSTITVNIKVVNASGNALENSSLSGSLYFISKGKLISRGGYSFAGFTGSGGYLAATCSIASFYEHKLIINLMPTLSYMGSISFIPVTSNQSSSCVLTADTASYFVTGNCYPITNSRVNAYPESGMSKLSSLFLLGDISDVDYFSNNFNFSLVDASGDYSIRLVPGTWALFDGRGPIDGIITRNLVVGPVASINNSIKTDPTSGVTVNVVLPVGAVSLDVVAVITFNNSLNLLVGIMPSWDKVSSTNMSVPTFFSAFNVTLVPTRNDAGGANPTINTYVEITIQTTFNFVDASKIRIYYYDPQSNRWSDAGITIVSIASNSITFRTTHLTLFALAEISYDLTAPVIDSIKFNTSNIINLGFITDRTPTINIMAHDVGVTADGISSYRVYLVNEQMVAVSGNDTGEIIITTSTTLNVALKLPLSFVDGTYAIKVLVKDAANNSVLQTSNLFRIGLNQSVQFTDALSAPNPFNPLSEIAHIGYQLNKAGTKIKLAIHSLNGSKIYSDEKTGIVGYNEFTWDGRDQFGSVVKNDVYLAFLTSEDGGKIVKTLIKIAVIK